MLSTSISFSILLCDEVNDSEEILLLNSSNLGRPMTCFLDMLYITLEQGKNSLASLMNL